MVVCAPAICDHQVQVTIIVIVRPGCCTRLSPIINNAAGGDLGEGRVHDQQRLLAGSRTESVLHEHPVALAGVRQGNIGDGDSPVDCARDVRTVQSPLVHDRRRAADTDAEGDIGAQTHRLIFRLRINVGRADQAQSGVGAGHRAGRIAHFDGVITRVHRLGIGHGQYGIGRAVDGGVVQSPLILQQRGAVRRYTERGVRAGIDGHALRLLGDGRRHGRFDHARAAVNARAVRQSDHHSVTADVGRGDALD